MKLCGIYIIKNLANGKIYVGKGLDINSRWRKHVSDLKRNKHDNEYLQRSWYKYGESNFEFLVVEECLPEHLNEKEKYYISKFKSKTPLGYNMTNGGDGLLNPSDEVRQKIAAGQLGRKRSSDSRKKQSESNKGRISPMLGRKHSLESKRKISEGNKGREHTIEERNKVSLARRGRNIQDSQKEKIRNTMLKNNTTKGENNGRSKITLSLVNTIKSLLENGMKNIFISRKLNISPTIISNIKNGRTWND